MVNPLLQHLALKSKPPCETQLLSYLHLYLFTARGPAPGSEGPEQGEAGQGQGEQHGAGRGAGAWGNMGRRAQGHPA